MSDKTRRSQGRRCAICGEPVGEHGIIGLSPMQRVAVVSQVRSRVEANAMLRGAQRVCPLVAVATLDGQPQRFRPSRLVGSGGDKTGKQRYGMPPDIPGTYKLKRDAQDAIDECHERDERGPGSWAVRGNGRKHGLHPVVDAVNDSEGSK